MQYRVLLLLLFLFCSLLGTSAQKPDTKESATLSILIKDVKTNLPLEFVHVILKKENKFYGKISDSKGEVSFHRIPKGEYSLSLSHLGYEGYNTLYNLVKNDTTYCLMEPSLVVLEEVYVTGRESKGIVTSTHINRTAIEHIQPSSFADLLELIPGGMSKDPDLGSPNHIALREISRPEGVRSKGKYDTPSLGTSFIIDGRPLGTGANMLWDVTQGVDMRSISTDEIDSVEIVRGIPSVEYGDLTSGLIKIKRKKGGSKAFGRFKSDLKSELYYLGKGIEFEKQKIKLNMGVDYMKYLLDPRSDLETYSRITASIRGEKKWQKPRYAYSLYSTFDYTGCLDGVKKDIIASQVQGKDESFSSYAGLIDFKITNRKKGFFKSLSAKSSLSYERRYVVRDGTIWGAGGSYLWKVDAREEGEHWGKLLGNKHPIVDTNEGKPVYAFSQVISRFGFSRGIIKNDVSAGADWRYSKNLGAGRVYSPETPPWRGFRYFNPASIPASNDLGLFIENNLRISLYKNTFTLQSGLRTTKSLGIDKRYYLGREFFFDPRVNLQWELPELKIGGDYLRFSVTGGIGWHTKMPTLAYLYPETQYTDFIQIAVGGYHLHYRTYIYDKTNYELQPARNEKRELRIDIEYAGFNLSVSRYFEDLKNGFRQEKHYKVFEFSRYHFPASFNFLDYPDPNLLPLDEIAREDLKGFALHPFFINGSRTMKRGTEYSFSSPRIKAIGTRISINGARMYTKYMNSLPIWHYPSQSFGGAEDKYIGHFMEDDSYEMWRSNTNLNFDTWIEKIGFSFSTSFQFLWKYARAIAPFQQRPFEFMTLQETIHPYTPEEIDKHFGVQALVKPPSSNIGTWEKWYVSVNLKMTKRLFKDKVGASLFVNKLIDYMPDEISGKFIKKRYQNAYFGMELNLKI